MADLEKDLLELPLNETQWDIFLGVIKHLDNLGVVSIPYIKSRYNTTQYVVDRITDSFLRLNWAFFSQGYLHISEAGKTLFASMKVRHETN